MVALAFVTAVVAGHVAHEGAWRLVVERANPMRAYWYALLVLLAPPVMLAALEAGHARRRMGRTNAVARHRAARVGAAGLALVAVA